MNLTFSVLDVERATPTPARIFTDIGLGDDGDLDTSTGDLVLLSDVDAVRQDVDIRLQFFRGEWFLNLDEGIPYYEEVLVKNPKLGAIKSIFIDAILSTPLVSAVNDLVLEYDAVLRTLAVTCSLTVDVSIVPIDYSKTFVIGE